MNKKNFILIVLFLVTSSFVYSIDYQNIKPNIIFSNYSFSSVDAFNNIDPEGISVESNTYSPDRSYQFTGYILFNQTFNTKLFISQNVIQDGSGHYNFFSGLNFYACMNFENCIHVANAGGVYEEFGDFTITNYVYPDIEFNSIKYIIDSYPLPSGTPPLSFGENRNVIYVSPAINISIVPPNAFPNVSVNYENNVCLNTSSNLENVNNYLDLHLVANDQENNTILYSTQVKEFFSNKTLYLQEFFKYGSNLIGLETCDSDYDFFYSRNFISNFTYNTEGFFSNPYKYNNEFRILTDNEEGYYCRKALVWSDGISLWRIQNNYRLNSESLANIIYQVTEKNTQFENIYYDSAFNKLTTITYNYTNAGNLEVYIDGSLNFSMPYDIKKDFTPSINFSVTNNRIIYSLFYNNAEVYTTTYYKNINDFMYIDFKTLENKPQRLIDENTKIVYVKLIMTWGLGAEFYPVFTSEPIERIGFNKTGNYYYTLYYSDNIHNESKEYRSILIQFAVSDCSGTTSPEKINGDYNSAYKAVKTGLNTICSKFPIKIDKYSISSCIIFTAISLLLQWLISIGIFFIFKDADITALGWSLIGLCASWVLPIATWYIQIEAFVFIVSVIVLLMRIFYGNGMIKNGGSNGE